MKTLRIVKTPDGTTRCRIRVDPPLCLVCGGVYGRLKDVACCPTVCEPKANETTDLVMDELFPHRKQ